MIGDGEKIQNLEDAARFALDELMDMTSDAFGHGADKQLRDRLAQALGYEDDDAYHNRPREENHEPLL
jgi:hypothetical protein